MSESLPDVGQRLMQPLAAALAFELDKPLNYPVNAKLARNRISGERDGWALHHAAVTKPRWSMTDKITYRLPSHTEEDPAEYTETVRDAISEAYHHNWSLTRRTRMLASRCPGGTANLSNRSYTPCM